MVLHGGNKGRPLGIADTYTLASQVPSGKGWYVTPKDKLVLHDELQEWGGTGAPWQNYAEQIKEVAIREGTKTSVCSSMFSRFKNITSLDLSNLDTSGVTSFDNMFLRCSGLTSLDLSSLSAASPTFMAGMFYGCASLETIDLSCLNTSKVRSMLGLFQECTALTSVNLSGLDTSSLTFIDLSPLDFSSVTNMTYMLAGCTQLKSVNLADVNSAKAEYLTGMFYGCSSLEGIDLTGLDTSSAVSFENMFRDCTKLKSADLTPLKTSQVTTLDKMFEDCTNLESVDMSNFDVSARLTTQAMFTKCGSLKTIMLSAGLVKRLDSWFPYAPSDNGWWSWEAQSWFTPSEIVQSRGMIADTYTATPVYNIKNATVSVADQTFTGSNITPALTVGFANNTLQEGTDYSVEYKNNKNAGVAEAIITGTGSYKGTTSKEFTIKPASISAATVSGVSDQAYTGRAIEPNPAVSL